MLHVRFTLKFTSMDGEKEDISWRSSHEEHLHVPLVIKGYHILRIANLAGDLDASTTMAVSKLSHIILQRPNRIHESNSHSSNKCHQVVVQMIHHIFRNALVPNFTNACSCVQQRIGVEP